MALDKLVDSTQLDSDLTSVANAIRTKGGTSAPLAFPAGFVSAVEAIPSGGVRTFQKLAEYVVTETVSQIDITVTDQMLTAEVLYVEFSNLNHTQDWVYTILNNLAISTGGHPYTEKETVSNAYFIISPVYKAPDYSPWVIMTGGKGLKVTTIRQITSLTSINIKLYSSASVFQSGTVRIWGYVA